MLNEDDRPESVKRLCGAVANLAKELIEVGGVSHAALAAGLRIEAGKIELAGPRVDMAAGERELVDLARKAHEFINSLIVAGIEERVAVVSISHVLIERIVRMKGAAVASDWLRSLANTVDANASTFTITATSH